MHELAQQIKAWGVDLGFQQIGITDIDLTKYESRFLSWLQKRFHGTMSYLEKHGTKRYRPAELVGETVRIISARMNYLPPNSALFTALNNPRAAYISRYALGGDYHRLMRKRLQQLAGLIKQQVQTASYRVFCDSAPVLEKALAEKAGLGWIGKHTNLLNSKAGSWFFLGEIYTNLPLPIDKVEVTSHCGSCTACITICPTKAIVAPYQLDARRCISYLTIELHEAIPLPFRDAIGNRIYGCDDCQLVCPWNKFAKYTQENAFFSRHNLHASTLVELFSWNEDLFLKRTEGSAIRRLGYKRWVRNIAVALGNAPPDKTIVAALLSKKNEMDAMVQEHITWALAKQIKKI